MEILQSCIKPGNGDHLLAGVSGDDFIMYPLPSCLDPNDLPDNHFLFLQVGCQRRQALSQQTCTPCLYGNKDKGPTLESDAKILTAHRCVIKPLRCEAEDCGLWIMVKHKIQSFISSRENDGYWRDMNMS